MEIISAICFLLFLFVLIKILHRSNKNSALKLPPGPKPLPIIGNIHQLVGPPMHRLLRDMAEKYGPLMHLQLGEVSTFVVSSPEVAEFFMKTHDTIFANRPQLFCPRVFNDNCNDIVFAPFGEYWRQMRKICVMELLSSKRVQNFCSIRENEALNLMRSISLNKGSTFNLSKELMSFMYGLTARIAFGKKSKFQEDFISVKSRVIVNAWAIGRDSRYWPDAEKFNPERFLDSAVDFQGKDFKYIPFGAGRRICPGISFGVVNIELILAQLLYHFDWKLPYGLSNEELDMTELFGLSVRRKNDLCLIPVPYNHSLLQEE